MEVEFLCWGITSQNRHFYAQIDWTRQRVVVYSSCRYYCKNIVPLEIIVTIVTVNIIVTIVTVDIIATIVTVNIIVTMVTVDIIVTIVSVDIIVTIVPVDIIVTIGNFGNDSNCS